MATTGSNEKTQPQKLLEEIIPHDENEKYPTDPDEPGPMWNAPKFPTIQEQQKYWEDKEKAAEPTPPRKWSLARRRRFNATLAKKKAGNADWAEAREGWVPVPPPVQEEPVAMIRFCPHCGTSIERFLA